MFNDAIVYSVNDSTGGVYGIGIITIIRCSIVELDRLTGIEKDRLTVEEQARQ